MKTIKARKIKGVLFDKDGTLLDFNRTWLAPFQRAAAYLEKCHSVDAAHLLACGGYVAASNSWRANSALLSGNTREVIACWQAAIGAPIGGDEMRQIESFFHSPHKSWAPVVDDLAGLCDELRALGAKLGIATMDSEANAHSMVRALELTAKFDFICGDDSGFGVKPEAGMVTAFCRECGLQCDEVAMVGDSPRDMEMGKNAGVALNVGVLSGSLGKADLSPLADIVVENIGALPDIIRRRHQN